MDDSSWHPLNFLINGSSRYLLMEDKIFSLNRGRIEKNVYVIARDIYRPGNYIFFSELEKKAAYRSIDSIISSMRRESEIMALKKIKLNFKQKNYEQAINAISAKTPEEYIRFQIIPGFIHGFLEEHRDISYHLVSSSEDVIERLLPLFSPVDNNEALVIGFGDIRRYRKKLFPKSVDLRFGNLKMVQTDFLPGEDFLRAFNLEAKKKLEGIIDSLFPSESQQYELLKSRVRGLSDKASTIFRRQKNAGIKRYERYVEYNGHDGNNGTDWTLKGNETDSLTFVKRNEKDYYLFLTIDPFVLSKNNNYYYFNEQVKLRMSISFRKNKGICSAPVIVSPKNYNHPFVFSSSHNNSDGSFYQNICFNKNSVFKYKGFSPGPVHMDSYSDTRFARIVAAILSEAKMGILTGYTPRVSSVKSLNKDNFSSIMISKSEIPEGVRVYYQDSFNWSLGGKK